MLDEQKTRLEVETLVELVVRDVKSGNVLNESPESSTFDTLCIKIVSIMAGDTEFSISIDSGSSLISSLELVDHNVQDGVDDGAFVDPLLDLTQQIEMEVEKRIQDVWDQFLHIFRLQNAASQKTGLKDLLEEDEDSAVSLFCSIKF